MRSTSVPRWDTSDIAVAPVDETVTCVVLITDESADEAAWEPAEQSAPTTVIVRLTNAQPLIPESILSQARVGWRFVVVAAETTVGRIRSQLVRAGAVDTEMITVTTEQPDIQAIRHRAVFCAHCHAVTDTIAAIDDIVKCFDMSGRSRCVLPLFATARGISRIPTRLGGTRMSEELR
ncbi:hypothetical protein [Rhodococcus sp. 27YEA15]|uniref:hypothetical protein n=1 Tax=Rhodococcus sp. 27YEA15 TaxID=3156259 RepID=UPI003C7A65FA